MSLAVDDRKEANRKARKGVERVNARRVVLAVVLVIAFGIGAHLLFEPSKPDPDPVGNCANALTVHGVIHHESLSQTERDPLCHGLTPSQLTQAVRQSTAQMGGNS
jgi:hypothetical protein